MHGGLLNGRYELREPLGSGGMATVWRGVDRVLGRPVAVKVMNLGLADDPRFAERFAREARHAAMLLHPTIVTVFDSGVSETGTPYLVMELVEGRTLAELLTEQSRLPVERAVAIAAAVCEALQVAHAAGLVHRDIKPGNIMVTDGGTVTDGNQVKVVDFGIAKTSSDDSQLTGTGAVLGTASYLAPEQATAAEVDGRADLYALGCVLTEMLTGRPPFDGATPVETAWKHVSERPAPPSALRPDIPPALDAAVLRLLAKEPARRPADASAARAELQAAVAGGAATTWMQPVAAPGYGQQAPYGGAPLNHTMAMPPLQSPYGGRHDGPYDPQYNASYGAPYDAPAPRRTGRRTALIAAAVVVVLGCVVAAVAASSNSSDATAASTPSVSASASPAASATAQPSDSPAADIPSADATDPAAMLASLRDAVATDGLSADQQGDLLDALDSATQSLDDQNPSDAAASVHDAQKALRKMGKQHALDPATLHQWQTQLSHISAALRNADSSGDNGGNNG